MILFDRATATEVLDAFRLYEGRLVGSGRRLSPGMLELREAAERSLRVRADQALAVSQNAGDADLVAPLLLTYDEVAQRLAMSKSTVQRLIRDGHLRNVHVLSEPRVHADDLAAYLDALREDSAA